MFRILSLKMRPESRRAQLFARIPVAVERSVYCSQKPNRCRRFAVSEVTAARVAQAQANYARNSLAAPRPRLESECRGSRRRAETCGIPAICRGYNWRCSGCMRLVRPGRYGAPRRDQHLGERRDMIAPPAYRRLNTHHRYWSAVAVLHRALVSVLAYCSPFPNLAFVNMK